MKELEIFINQMKTELDNNSHKGDWRLFTDRNKIMEEFYYHLDKLENVRLTNGDPILMREYIADCANILMFLNNTINE